MKPLSVIVTCEHAVNTIPSTYKNHFASHADLLQTHRGYDIGALGIARTLVHELDVPFFQAKVSRLLIDNNRSLHHPDCLSFITQAFPEQARADIIERYYWSYRNEVTSCIKDLLKKEKTVLHLSIHSFTPILNHEERKADLGLLYDPARKFELKLSKKWMSWLKHEASDLVIKRNYPYEGKSDGLTTACRQAFDEDSYIGFEIESNQAKVENKAVQQRFGLLLARMIQSL